MFMSELDKLQYSHRTFSITTEGKTEKYKKMVGKRKETFERREFELSVYDELASVCVHTEKVDDLGKAVIRFRELKSEYTFDYQKKLSASNEH